MSKLTREQVEEWLFMGDGDWNDSDTIINRIMAHDATAQARITELEQECARLSVFHADDEPSWRLVMQRQ